MYAEFEDKSIEELLELSQTNVSPNPHYGLMAAETAFVRAQSPVHVGTAARQAGFRAEQAGEDIATVENWSDRSRTALSADEPEIKRETIATDLLEGRAIALRVERHGLTDPSVIRKASKAFEHGEETLKEQHQPRKSWDRFGTMLARHRATHEAMNGSAGLAATTATRGLWRAIRAEREGTPKKHVSFVFKQLGMNAMAGCLAVSKPLDRFVKVADSRHRLALKLLG